MRMKQIIHLMEIFMDKAIMYNLLASEAEQLEEWIWIPGWLKGT